jgi:hypothetical protein
MEKAAETLKNRLHVGEFFKPLTVFGITRTGS